MAKSIAPFILILFCISLFPLSKAHALGVEAMGMSWVEEGSFSSAGQSRPIRTTFFGTGLLVDHWKTNKRNRWGIAGGLGIGRGHGSNVDANTVFNQTYISTYWATIIPGYRYRISDGYVELGLSLPLNYRIAQYVSSINGAEVTFPDRQKFLYGMAGELIWNFNRDAKFIQRIVMPLQAKVSPMWTAGVGWVF